MPLDLAAGERAAFLEEREESFLDGRKRVQRGGKAAAEFVSGRRLLRDSRRQHQRDHRRERIQSRFRHPFREGNLRGGQNRLRIQKIQHLPNLILRQRRRGFAQTQNHALHLLRAKRDARQHPRACFFREGGRHAIRKNAAHRRHMDGDFGKKLHDLRRVSFRRAMRR